MKQAQLLWRSVVPTLMSTALEVATAGQVQSSGCRHLLDRLIANASHGEDAIEVMLVEQLAVAHYRAAQLQTKAAEAKNLEAARVYNGAAGRMLAEFRKTALALLAYREKSLALARAEREAEQSGVALGAAGDPEPAQANRAGGNHAQKAGQRTGK
jgi:hypothetical protein